MTIADPVVKGEPAPWPELPAHGKFSKSAGWGTERTWRGPLAGIDAQLTVVAALNPETIDYTRNSPAEISAFFPDAGPSGYNEDQSAVDNAIWELDPIEIEKRLESHPHFRSDAAGNDIALATHAATMETINKAILDGTAATADYSTDGPWYNHYAYLRLLGTDAYPLYTWLIRRTISVSRTSQIKASFENVGKIIPYAGISVPSSVKWGDILIHDWYQGSWGAWNLSGPYECWLVKPPRVAYDARTKKHTIQNEWLGAPSWSAFLYDGGTATP